MMIKIFAYLSGILMLTGLPLKNTTRNPVIVIRTVLGEITVELFADNAPMTVANFLAYVDAEMYDSSCFYRIVRSDNQPTDSVKIAVIQGGRWQKEDKGFPPIKLETTRMTGILHKNGTISMARASPDSATSEFFICIGDQPELDFGGKRNKDGKGFAAFGKVVNGIDVVYRVHSIDAPEQYLENKVIIIKINRLSK
jgi:peptidyl-prolyl cis-trans isomerase A (cyclophilin A)